MPRDDITGPEPVVHSGRVGADEIMDALVLAGVIPPIPVGYARIGIDVVISAKTNAVLWTTKDIKVIH